jgi:hypothetical protein
MTSPVFCQRVRQVLREHPGIGLQGIADYLGMRYSTFMETYHLTYAHNQHAKPSACSVDALRG